MLIGTAPDGLKSFLDMKFPKSKKSENTLGVSDPKLAANINETLGLKCVFTGVVPEIVRGSYRSCFISRLAVRDINEC